MAHCDLFINQAMNAIIPNENFDNEYVYYAVKNILPNIKMLDSGTASGRENVSKSAFSKMQILIEDNIITQRRIAEILFRYDSLIENYQNRLSYWKNQHSVSIKNGLLIYVFQGMRILRLWMGYRKDGRKCV